MPTEYNTTKWGRVAILDGGNYPEFKSTCTAALAVIDAWNIVDGSDPEPPAQPRATYLEWKDRNQKAIQIISGSIQPRFLPKITPYIQAKDVPGIWIELAKFNRANDPVFNSTVREQFSTAEFDPKAETIRDFSSRLYGYKTSLDGSDFNLTDRDIILRLLAALPAKDPLWQQAKHFAIREKHDLEGTITLLQSYKTAPETTKPAKPTESSTPPPKAAAFARHSRRDKRGGSSDKKRKYEDRGSQSKPPEHQNDCYFCSKKGYFQKDCCKYERARARAQRRNESSSGSESESESKQEHKPKRSKSRDKGKERERSTEHAGLVSHFATTEPECSL
ncbi:hypothetical protein OIDMADRAFT_51509 [Oidiodendron maius Zn]|uniref:CCHC-type domain-containing protein n=1 Tax=Oidiodendron maius (strain Zn) TaxID=913774 RepID=A0A0C3CX17_OIDMZ|nr:hypothetical protein OIDMADRAFT_51509 [Oidiodendron maius Zn]